MTGIDTCDIVKNRLKLVIGSHRLDIEFSHRNKQRFGEEYKILYEYPEYFLDYREMLDPTIIPS